MTPRDRVAKLYPQALGTHFSRLLRYAWVTVGLYFNPGHHMGNLFEVFEPNLMEHNVSELTLTSFNSI
jgi:hypothetical protein